MLADGALWVVMIALPFYQRWALSHLAEGVPLTWFNHLGMIGLCLVGAMLVVLAFLLMGGALTAVARRRRRARRAKSGPPAGE
jgi:uncharacterized membrane protein